MLTQEFSRWQKGQVDTICPFSLHKFKEGTEYTRRFHDVTAGEKVYGDSQTEYAIGADRDIRPDNG